MSASTSSPPCRLMRQPVRRQSVWCDTAALASAPHRAASNAAPMPASVCEAQAGSWGSAECRASNASNSSATRRFASAWPACSSARTFFAGADFADTDGTATVPGSAAGRAALCAGPRFRRLVCLARPRRGAQPSPADRGPSRAEGSGSPAPRRRRPGRSARCRMPQRAFGMKRPWLLPRIASHGQRRDAFAAPGSAKSGCQARTYGSLTHGLVIPAQAGIQPFDRLPRRAPVGAEPR